MRAVRAAGRYVKATPARYERSAAVKSNLMPIWRVGVQLHLCQHRDDLLHRKSTPSRSNPSFLTVGRKELTFKTVRFG